MKRLFGFVLIQLLLGTIPVLAQQEVSNPESATTEAVTAQPIPANQISERALNTAALLRSVASEGEVKEELETLKEELSVRKKQIDDLQKETLKRLKIEGPVSIIEEDVKEWIRIQGRLEGWIETLSSRAETLDSVLEKIRLEKEIWSMTRSSPSARDLPTALRRQVRTTQESIDKVLGELLSSRDAILNLKVSIGHTLARVDEIVEEQKKEITRRRKGVFRIDSPPLWAISDQFDSQGNFSDQIKSTWEVNSRWIRRYLSEQRNKLMGYSLLLIVLLVTFGFLRRKVRLWAQQDKRLLATQDLLERPIAAALVICILTFELLNADAPKAWIALLGFFFLLAVIRILPKVSLQTDRSWPYLLALLFFLEQVVRLTPDGYLINRLALFLLSLAGLLISLWLSKPWEGISLTWQKVIRIGAQTSAILFGIGTFANLVGSVGLAMIVNTGTLYAIFAVVVLLLAVVLLRALVIGVMLLPLLRRFGIFSRKAETTQRVVFRIITIVAVVAWVVSALRGFLLLDYTLGILKSILEVKVSIGQFSLTVESVLSLALVIWLSFQVSRLIRFLLKTDILPSMKLSRGVPETALRLTHYTVIVIGFFIGISAAGFPLDKMTIIFGAFGVGIGFGLQNIVNNFVSGLILLFERPIQIGDRIELSTMGGVVQEMGIRASTVRTYQGASVIVPNANLISNEVVNWTHRDEQRRVEIMVGVAYGTDPQQVIELLMQVAKDHPEVAGHPAPEVLFRDFGPSSLDFQLRVWVGAERWVSVDSELRVAISGAITQAGIEIPFPQRDLHLKSIDESIPLQTVKPENGQA